MSTATVPSPMDMLKSMTTTFDALGWAKRWRENEQRRDRNSCQDSGWSADVAHGCDTQSRILANELLNVLREIRVESEDFFDRPALVAVVAAADEALRRPLG